MKDELIAVLEEYRFPIMMQGSLGANEPYPSNFFTIWNTATDGAAFYDNEAQAYIWEFDMNFYSDNPVRVNTIMLDVRQRLRRAGWSVSGKGYDVPSDENTHTGRGIHISRRENNHKEE